LRSPPLDEQVEAPADGQAVDVSQDPALLADSAQAESADDLLARLQDAERERDKHLDDLRRVAADFDNYRKRVAREQMQMLARSGERVVAKLLPVLDDLERALDAAEHHEEAKVLEGVRMTRDALAAVLASEGVEEIDAEGPFDPHVHEALLTQPAEGVETGHVVQVVQRGYRMGDVVVRPARVVVAE
ncbi:MAG TPA: nucleotide exchange factor GrpE, partial [Gaiella sp.]|nr:nucleotide exchange factor GrpE [Gaiella sp.]